MPLPRPRAALRLVASCLVLGVGVGLVLLARLGSDGYSSLVNGAVRASGLPYGMLNVAIGGTAVALAAARRVRPGLGTVVHPLVVGLTVQTVLDRGPMPQELPARLAFLVIGVIVVALGVAGYLGAGLGAGPVEGAALALRPLPFRSAYMLLQAASALTGWLLGADVGVGTLVVVLGVGPLVQLLKHRSDSAESRCQC